MSAGWCGCKTGIGSGMGLNMGLERAAGCGAKGGAAETERCRWSCGVSGVPAGVADAMGRGYKGAGCDD